MLASDCISFKVSITTHKIGRDLSVLLRLELKVGITTYSGATLVCVRVGNYC